MTRSVLYTTAALVVLAALGGFRLGLQQGDLADASGLIERVAAKYEAEHGGDPMVCFGWLNADGDLLNVRCDGVRYEVDRFGQISEVTGDGA